MPSTTGSVSRARPRRRATISAREGSPRRAGSVADISTPMNVPCIASRRLALRQVGAAARIACQAIARANIEAHIRPRPAASRPGLEASRLAATRPTPMCTSASSASARPPSEAATSATRRSARFERSRAEAIPRARRETAPGSGLEARQALGGDTRQQVGGHQAEAHPDPGGARRGPPDGQAPARSSRAPRRRRAARQSARRAARAAAAIRARAAGSSASERSASASASASPGGVSRPSTPSRTTSR